VDRGRGRAEGVGDATQCLTMKRSMTARLAGPRSVRTGSRTALVCGVARGVRRLRRRRLTCGTTNGRAGGRNERHRALRMPPRRRLRVLGVSHEITILGQCVYKMKPCGRCGRAKSHSSHRKKGGTCPFQRRLGCATCGQPKSWAGHLGAPESFNAMAGRDPNIYRAAVDRWADALGPLLVSSGLPMGLGRIVVEGEVSFGDGRDRDQGNHRVIVEKAVGDALVRGGYLPNDTWSRYRERRWRGRGLRRSIHQRAARHGHPVHPSDGARPGRLPSASAPGPRRWRVRRASIRVSSAHTAAGASRTRCTRSRRRPRVSRRRSSGC
jgi:hypothetical protein